jgi:hypothetical protein
VVCVEHAMFDVFEHAEGFVGVIDAQQVVWVEDGAQFVSVEAVEVCVSGVAFASELGSAFGIEAEGWAVVAEILGPGLEIVAGVGEFEDAVVDEAGGASFVRWMETESLQSASRDIGRSTIFNSFASPLHCVVRQRGHR